MRQEGGRIQRSLHRSGFAMPRSIPLGRTRKAYRIGLRVRRPPFGHGSSVTEAFDWDSGSTPRRPWARKRPLQRPERSAW